MELFTAVYLSCKGQGRCGGWIKWERERCITYQHFIAFHGGDINRAKTKKVV